MSDSSPPRRRFLQKVVAVVPASTLAAGAATWETAQADTGTSAASTAPDYKPTYFADAEWRFINAAVDLLIPADQYGPGAIAAGVPEFIDRQMDTAYGHGKLWYMNGPFHPDVDPTYGYQLSLNPREIYRHGIESCNNWCQKQHSKAFADLDKPTQTQILSDLEHGKIELDALPAKTFFSYLLQNTKEGFLSDPQYGGNRNMVGWKMINFPGARGDFADWSDQYNVKYPYGPVSISGEKG